MSGDQKLMHVKLEEIKVEPTETKEEEQSGKAANLIKEAVPPTAGGSAQGIVAKEAEIDKEELQMAIALVKAAGLRVFRRKPKYGQTNKRRRGGSRMTVRIEGGPAVYCRYFNYHEYH